MGICALIFDLDDTLMDTHGQLVPKAHRDACVAMQAAGLEVPLEDLLATRWQILRTQPRVDVNQQLAAHYGYHDSPHISLAGHQTFYRPCVTGIKPFPGTHSVLQSLQQEYQLCLVTAGVAAIQQSKIDELAIGDYFSEVLFVDPEQEEGPSTKYEAFVRLREQAGWLANEVVVIGDRLDNEIAAARQLGFWALRMHHGEYAHLEPNSAWEEPHFTIRSISEIMTVLQDLEQSVILTGESK